MPKLIHQEICTLNACMFVGKAITTSPQNPNIAEFWEQCSLDDTFDQLQRTQGTILSPMAGFECEFKEKEFTYGVGYFMSLDTQVPSGYFKFEIPECLIQKTWIEGPIPDVYGATYPLSLEAAQKSGYTPYFKLGFSSEIYDETRFGKALKQSLKEVVLDYWMPVTQN